MGLLRMRMMLSAVREIRARESWSRERVLEHQTARLRDLVAWVWQHSPFYRRHYADHGIREADLPGITAPDLPVINKEILMAHFDEISEDPLLRRDKIEAWIHSDAPLGRYSKDYVVVHTSGTGGTMGIFAHDHASWIRARATASVRSNLPVRINPFRPYRITFYGAAHGRFAGVTSLVTAPKLFTRRLVCSVLDPVAETVRQLNAFQPEFLSGYPSAIEDLALRAVAGELDIRPRFILTGGEVLTRPMAETIERGLGLKPVDAYASSESMCIALQRRNGPGMSLMEDENIVEILDAADRPVAPGDSGRVVLTNLNNRAIPIIRYDLRDIVTRGHRNDDEPFEPILGVDGRANDALPIRSASGSEDSVHPVVLSEFFVPGIQKFQFVGTSPDRIAIRYMASTDIDQQVRQAFARILDMKAASPDIEVSVHRVGDLPADEKTGKFRLVRVGDQS